MIFRQTYGTQQTDTTIITPASGKKIIVWKAMLNAGSNATFEFLTSAIEVASIKGAGGYRQSNNGIEGATDEEIKI